MIARVEFTVRDPISVNRAYGRRKGGKGDRYLTAVGRDFKTRVALAALVARSQTTWPPPETVGHARLSYQLFDYRGDVDGPAKLTRDALEGILFANDRIVADGEHPLPIRDGKGKRIEVVVEVFSVISQAEAAERAAAADARRIRRPSTRTHQLRKPRWVA